MHPVELEWQKEVKRKDSGVGIIKGDAQMADAYEAAQEIFRKGGNMLAIQGGFIDHLQVFLPTSVEEITMQAGGADGPRQSGPESAAIRARERRASAVIPQKNPPIEASGPRSVSSNAVTSDP